MKIQDKPPAIVQCSLGDMRHPIATTTGLPHKPARILLRLAANDSGKSPMMPKGVDLTLDLVQFSIDSLRNTLDRLSQRYQIIALLPPPGASLAELEAGRIVATVAEDRGLPNFGSRALAIASNRYLSRCHWQKAGLPTSAFSLIQFPSALSVAAASIGYPAQLSPLHYALPHLSAHIQREGDLSRAHQLVAGVLHRHTLSHPMAALCEGCDPRTGHHIRFSPETDMVLSAAVPSERCTLAVITRDGNPQVQACRLPRLRKKDLQSVLDLAAASCSALGMQNGVATCMIHHRADGNVVEDIMPQYIDHQLMAEVGTQYISAFLSH